ncbi:UNKNOWN [Stylonychia lemnae]|uniref:Transmembrane protein n=1 Tax=Stylonychia lemnae TaxID=5949 RepID=A0A077ZSQ3_STYLE|nr:UNKNOWN [Stylonychia lemnae]|eukprot:CDW71506.1 UNKNOWN [Stylonychia lemnae]
MSRVKKLKELITNLDSFGHPITLTYKNQSTYKSLFGGIVTILIQLVVGGYFISQLAAVFNRDGSQITRQTKIMDLVLNDQKIQLDRSNFEIAFNFWDSNFGMNDLDVVAQYLQIRAIVFEILYDPQIGITQQQRAIKLEKCGIDRFNGRSDVVTNLGIVDHHICFQKDFDASLYGSTYSQNVRYISANITKCSQQYLDEYLPDKNFKCKSDKEIDDFANGVMFELVYMYNTFEENDFDSPIKQQISAFYSGLNSDRRAIRIYSVQKNFAERRDSYFANSLSTQRKEFYQIRQEFDFNTKQVENQDTFLAIQFFQSNQQETIQRSAFTLIDAITNTGGLVSIIFLVTQILIKRIQQQLFFQSLINSNYLFYEKDKVQKPNPDQKIPLKQETSIDLKPSKKHNQNGKLKKDLNNIFNHSVSGETFQNDMGWRDFDEES